MAVINQKEYLKKYLSLGDEKEKSKKRKKKAKIIKDRVKIIDDDIDVPRNENELKEFLTAEDAPQIVGIIDERPLHMRIDDYRKSDKWKLVGSDDELKESEIQSQLKSKQIKQEELDFSPPRKQKRTSRFEDISPVRSKRELDRKTRFDDSDTSPLRKSRNVADSDTSPLRKSRKISDSNTNLPRRSRKKSESDASPPRKKSESDNSPLRKYKNLDSDPSPPRKYNKRFESDVSPLRHSRKISNIDNNPARKHEKSDSDTSPPRRNKKYSPDRNHKSKNKYNSDSSLLKKNSKYDRYERKEKYFNRKNKRSESVEEMQKRYTPPKKLTKTLDGKSAGIQFAGDLKKETVALKKREDDMFKNMSADVSGKDAVPIMRDRKTGKKRDLEREVMEELEKQKKQNERKKKYDKWGRGLKQVEDHKEKMQEELHEMSKPLARYADDEDLEKYLREQEREGDPMLEYIRKKKRKEAIASGKPIDTKPLYDGEFMPNRYGIPPGHRWDGVDRSNGYEKEWFKVQNSKKAVQEDVYKWSVEDI